MSSTPASSSVAASTSNVQSASNKANEESSKDANNTTVRPASAQKSAVDTTGASATAGSGDVVSPTLTPSDRPVSASKQPTTTTEVRPGSAKKGDPTLTPALDATAVRPPSASQKPQDTTAVTGTRPASASQKQNDAATSNTAPVGSRPPSAKTSGETATTNPVTGQQDTSPPVDPNDPNVTKPIIGRPASGAKKDSSEVPSAAHNLAALNPVNPPPSGDAGGPSSSRAGSAATKTQAKTTTENKS